MTDRGVSVTLNYVLSLAITTVLVSGLVFAAGDIVGDRRDAVVRGELSVVGEQLSASLASADRLARTGADTVELEVDAPDRVGGQSYTITVDPASEVVVLSTSTPTVTIRVPYRTETPVVADDTNGGPVVITLSGSGELEVRSA